MDLFPYIFGRSGGGAINELDILKNSQQLLESVGSILQLNAKLDLVGQRIVDLLYLLIQEEEDIGTQNSLLNLKRAVYNKREANLAPSFFNTYFEGDKAREVMSLLTGYSTLSQEIQLLLNESSTLHQGELSTTIKELDKLCQKYYLSNGFLFASEKLSHRVGKNTYYKKQKQKTVFSLLKYLTRSVAKTSPFSTFNAVFCMKKGHSDFTIVEAEQTSGIHPNVSLR